MTGQGDPTDRTDPADPPTSSSVGSTFRIPGPAAVPPDGVWVGPPDDPARYERLQHVGGGAEGTIWRARYRNGDGAEPDVVALKEYRLPPGAPPGWPFDGTWHQIEEQAFLLRGLPRTDHLVRVRQEFLGAVSTGAGPPDRRRSFHTPFVVMEWIEGTRPDSGGGPSRSDPATRLGWIRDLADAVDLLHSVSRTSRSALVHGDIKPGNCLVTAHRGLVLVDTGALQRADSGSNLRGLRTPPYAAPEVLAHPGRRRDVATDLYSLGAVAFFLITGEAPPSAEHPTYLDDARRSLLARTGVPEHRRAELAGHVLRLLDRDPRQRTRTSAVQWARGLTDIVSPTVTGPADAGPTPRRPARPRASLLGGLTGLVLLGAAVLVPSALESTTPPGPPSPGAADGRTPGTPEPGPGTWPSRVFADLPVFAAGGGEVVYAQDYTAPAPEWPVGRATGYETAYRDSGYQLHVPDRGAVRPVIGPPVGSPTDEVVSATARFRSGQGAWGVWCRGVDRAGSQRYEFLLSHAGAVQIAGPDAGTGWVYVEGLDVSAPVTLSAHCADVVGAPVRLTLAVNGRTALTLETGGDGDGAILGPGYAGIEGMTFADVAGPTVTATYSRFEIRRAAPYQ